MSKKESLLNSYPDETFLFADGFDEAILGVDSVSLRIVYSKSKCLDILQSMGMDEEEAIEYFEFNVSGAYVGEQTPIYLEELVD